MGKMFGLPQLSLTLTANIFLQILLTTIIVLLNLKIYQTGFKNLLQKKPNMDSLVVISTLTAYLYSIYLSYLQLMTKGEMLNIETYFESSAFILIFIALGKYLEALTKGKTSEAIKKLIGLQPQTATILKNNYEVAVPISEVKVGDIVLVKPSQKIPVDGIVLTGYSSVDEKMITGESLPVAKKKGDKLIGGTINTNSVLTFRATKVGDQTMLAQIIKIVEEAMSSKAPIQDLVDKISFYFVPTIIIVAAASLIIWLLSGYPINFAINAFVSVLIIACPCALGLATPTAIMVGTGLAAQKGILIKSGKALEMVEKIDSIVFDKTGTLTVGKPKVTDVVATSKYDDKIILQIAYSLENNSKHPLAQAVISKAKNEGLEINKVEEFTEFPGKGISGKINAIKYSIGTKKFISEQHITIMPIVDTNLTQLENVGKTVVYIAQDKQLIGLIAIADTIKPYAKEIIEQLKRMGKKIIMITGDRQRVSYAIAKGLNIDNIVSEVLPQNKAKEISKLQQEGNIIAMIGDGINDAPALAQADLGIALGSGTDVAIETGEIILIKNDLRDVVSAINISKFTLKKIKQNLFWAFFYNVVSVPVAAGVLYPITGWLLNPALAAATMALSSVSVIANALLMKRYK